MAVNLLPLIAIAAQSAPLITRILSGKIGRDNAELVNDVIYRVAERSGVEPDFLPDFAGDNPEVVQKALVEVEQIAPELIDLSMKALEGQFQLLLSEKSDPVWMRAWRPLGMYTIGFLWLWSVVGLHVLNAMFKIALPQPDLWVLFQLTMLYMGLYMGGHTAKDLMGKFAATRRAGVA